MAPFFSPRRPPRSVAVLEKSFDIRDPWRFLEAVPCWGAGIGTIDTLPLSISSRLHPPTRCSSAVGGDGQTSASPAGPRHGYGRALLCGLPVPWLSLAGSFLCSFLRAPAQALVMTSPQPYSLAEEVGAGGIDWFFGSSRVGCGDARGFPHLYLPWRGDDIRARLRHQRTDLWLLRAVFCLDLFNAFAFIFIFLNT